MNEYRNFEGFNEAGEAITGMTSLHAAPEDFKTVAGKAMSMPASWVV